MFDANHVFFVCSVSMMKLAALFTATLTTYTAFAAPKVFECDAEVVGAAAPDFSLRVSTEENTGLTAKIDAHPALIHGETETVTGDELTSDAFTIKNYVEFITKFVHRSPLEITSADSFGWENQTAENAGDIASLMALVLRDRTGQIVGIGGSLVRGESEMQSWICRR